MPEEAYIVLLYITKSKATSITDHKCRQAVLSYSISTQLGWWTFAVKRVYRHSEKPKQCRRRAPYNHSVRRDLMTNARYGGVQALIQCNSHKVKNKSIC